MKLKEIVRELYRLEEQKLNIQAQIDSLKNKVQSAFDEKGLQSVEVLGDESTPTLVVKKMERVNISYDVDKLKTKLETELLNELLNKSYEVSDMHKLIKLMRDNGVQASEFKSCIKTTETLDRERLKQMYAIGDIKLNDIKGCYTAKITKSISIKPKKGDND